MEAPPFVGIAQEHAAALYCPSYRTNPFHWLRERLLLFLIAFLYAALHAGVSATSHSVHAHGSLLPLPLRSVTDVCPSLPSPLFPSHSRPQGWIALCPLFLSAPSARALRPSESSLLRTSSSVLDPWRRRLPLSAMFLRSRPLEYSSRCTFCRSCGLGLLRPCAHCSLRRSGVMAAGVGGGKPGSRRGVLRLRLVRVRGHDFSRSRGCGLSATGPRVCPCLAPRRPASAEPPSFVPWVRFPRVCSCPYLLVSVRAPMPRRPAKFPLLFRASLCASVDPIRWSDFLYPRRKSGQRPLHHLEQPRVPLLSRYRLILPRDWNSGFRIMRGPWSRLLG